MHSSRHSSLCSSHQRVLALDIGTFFTGVAVGNYLSQTATPLCTIRGAPLATMHQGWLAQLQKLICEWQVDVLLLGSPIQMDGSEFWMTRFVNNVARKIKKETCLPLFFEDERLTTWEAKNLQLRTTRSPLGKISDPCSAALLLESFLRRTQSAHDSAK